MLRTVGVEAMFAEQHSNTVGPSYPIIQSSMMTSPIVIFFMVTSPMVKVVVSVGYETHIGDDDWVGGGINFDNLDFESDESENEDYWMDEDNSSDDDDDEDEDGDEYI